VVVQVVVALLRGDGSLLYEALAREEDRRPYAATGFAVAGWGDAVGEPIGSRFGKRRYRVPGLGGVTATRSLEGSLAVFAASFIAAALSLAWLGWGGTARHPIVIDACLVALAATVIEALTHHGLDNLTVQLGAAAVAWGLA
jgi:phytol kinase